MGSHAGSHEGSHAGSHSRVNYQAGPHVASHADYQADSNASFAVGTRTGYQANSQMGSHASSHAGYQARRSHMYFHVGYQAGSHVPTGVCLGYHVPVRVTGSHASLAGSRRGTQRYKGGLLKNNLGFDVDNAFTVRNTSESYRRYVQGILEVISTLHPTQKKVAAYDGRVSNPSTNPVGAHTGAVAA